MMPFIRVDEELFDEMVSELDDEELAEHRPSGEFEYSSAEAQFKPEQLGRTAQAVLKAVRAMGATHFRIRYDGGYDEGFSHPEYLTINNQQRSAESVASELAKSPLVGQIREAAKGERYNPYENIPDANVARYAIDELAHALASQLLGEGYGTGEYELYGALTADLTSGEISDDPEASPPNPR